MSVLVSRLAGLLDRDLVYAASRVLPDELFEVWIAKHGLGLGRRSGALRLRVSEEQFRYRAAKAERLLAAHMEYAA